MQTLTIPEIFSDFSFYQQHYLSIITQKEQYFTPVQGAFIQVWPIGTQPLYLGDLLQLWFSEKWLIQSPCQLLLESYRNGRKQPLQREHDLYLYLYELSGSALSGRNHSKVWSLSEQKTLPVYLDSVFKYYCLYSGTSRPEIPEKNLRQALKSAL